MSDYSPNDRSKLADWLDRLQQESWQLELLISGFVIFLLLGAYTPLDRASDYIDRLQEQHLWYGLLIVPYGIVLIAYYILLFNLLVHVFLRGLWISTVGLRYVSGEIDYERLRLQPRFTGWLRGRIGTFDRYIERLEQLCSAIFAFTFLLIFAVFGLGTFLFFLVAAQLVLRWLAGVPLDGSQTSVADLVGVLLLLLCGLIYLVDFLTLGWVKRRQRLARFYYPIYRLMGWITLAALYRPLYYNLIDNTFGRRMAYAVVPTVVGVMLVLALRLIGNPYMPYGLQGEPEQGDWVFSAQYETTATDIDYHRPSIPAPHVASGYLPVFIPYLPARHDAVLQRQCPEVEPARYAGLKLRGTINAGRIVNEAADAEAILQCLRGIFRVRIDDRLRTDVTLRYYYHPVREQYGLYGNVPIHDLAPTEHYLQIDQARGYKNGRLQWQDGQRIYFWKEE